MPRTRSASISRRGCWWGSGSPAPASASCSAVVARAFPPEKRSVAVGIAGACGSFGQFAMLPWGQALICSYGWLNALVVLGVVSFFMVPLGAALAGRNAAGQESTQSIGAALAEAAASAASGCSPASFFVCGFQTIFIMVHLPAYLVDRGLGAQHAMSGARGHRPLQHRRLLRRRRARRALQPQVAALAGSTRFAPWRSASSSACPPRSRALTSSPR